MNTLGQKKLAAYYQYSMEMYWDFMTEKEKSRPVSTDLNAPFGYWKKNLREAEEPKPVAPESKTDTEIITQADGSRTLMITTHIGETETLMSVKLSEPSDNQNDYVKAAANEIASEHVEILTQNPYEIMPKIRNAGALFLGEYSSEPLGDYFAGPNHILPTNGTAKFFSPLNVDDFMKKTSIIAYSEEALRAVHKDIELFAESEGLTAHANSIKVRFEE